ncbi:MAG: 3-phosphoshikimate 1-carboxyvinyltransferase [Verrucomicrobiota bacterium]|nr:3-phosphoshikimate 1-carboxyvinyltransferase [Verrucomicrobiota bacterium]
MQKISQSIDGDEKSSSITTYENPVNAKVRVPGSKSYTNRALVMAALTKGPVSLRSPLYSDDTEAMIECLTTLGIHIEKEADQIIVHGDVSAVANKNHLLFTRDSGTTARFMLALSCIVPGIKTIQGSKRLSERPINDLVNALREMSAKIEYIENDYQLPIKVSTSSLSGNSVHLKGDLSSQFCSALLLISPYISKGLTIHIAGPLISKPYVDMTLSYMQEWDVKVIEKDGTYRVPEGQSYRKNECLVEGDYSSAGYFFAIAALTKSKITVENLNPFSTQPDRKFLDILAKMGNVVTYGENEVTVEGRQVIAQSVDMEDCPDQVMTLALLAAFAKGVTRISGVRSLRHKETDRVSALRKELGKMGIRTEEMHNSLIIYGTSPHAAEIETYNDHRIAMAFAVAGMCLEGMVICHPEVVNKTFPTFWDILDLLRN